MPTASPTLRIDLVSTPAQLRDVHRMDDETPGAVAVPWDVLLGWWTAYCDGILALRADGVVIGYTSLWPVTRVAYETLRSGQRRAGDLTISDMSAAGHDPQETWWYWSSVALRPAWRGQGLGGRFTDIAMQRWLRGVDEGHLVHVTALAWSSAGIQVLLQRGFHCRVVARETVANMATYDHTATAGAWRAIATPPAP